MIDLHIHSTYSDGTDTVKEILEKAEELKLEYISITDHDNCNAYLELEKLDVKKIYNGKIIAGIEIKCALDSRIIEILGYKFDCNKMKKWTDDFYKDKSKEKLQEKYFNILYDNCIKKGLILKNKNEINFDAKKDWASVCIYNELKNNDKNVEKVPEDFLESFDTFSKKYCADREFGLYIDKSKDYPSIQEAVNIIKQCGGLVFIPHVYIYKWIKDFDKHLKTLIKEYNIDGVECFHSEFNQENIEHLIDFCKKENLLISGGTDYHGRNKKNIDLAFGKGNLHIDQRYIQNWVEE